MALGEEFVIILDSNPTTGYKWELKFHENIIALLRKGFEQQSDGIGSGGKEKFEFKGLKDGETDIKMIYKRPWENKTIKTSIFKIRIT